jgi:23S rRNA (cytosine1962-C5)-methyltransferase
MSALVSGIPVVSADAWTSYKLLDCADGLKLEQFGEYTLLRPEPQAIWSGPKHIELQAHHARFTGDSPSTGHWRQHKPVPERWNIRYTSEQLNLQFRLALTSFKHVGLFPEQAANWEFAAAQVRRFPADRRKVLNLFAYTGGASLAAAQAGATVTHVDSVKQVVNWAGENAKLNGIENIRWIVDDAVKFVQREIRRGNTYQGIILDPPAYGHGPNGEKWKLEEQIDSLVGAVAQLLDPEFHFLVLNTYSLGFSALITDNLLKRHMPASDRTIAEIAVRADSGVVLPLGVVGRLSSLRG